jgi:uncharacterized protein (DUF433 family)
MVSAILHNPAEVLRSYPVIQEPNIQAVLAYAAELAREGTAEPPLEHTV